MARAASLSTSFFPSLYESSLYLLDALEWIMVTKAMDIVSKITVKLLKERVVAVWNFERLHLECGLHVSGASFGMRSLAVTFLGYDGLLLGTLALLVDHRIRLGHPEVLREADVST